jgi:hypothetical protein
VEAAISEFFKGQIPQNFELHAHELINGTGPFATYSQDDRNAFALSLLDVIATLKHKVFFVGIDKPRLAAALPGDGHKVINCGIPYLLGFNYLVTCIERYIRRVLGQSARGMIILDKKDTYQEDIDKLTRYRRYEIPNVRKLKWIVEFSYPIDSVRHPLVQLSDVVIYLSRKFLECENGYRENWTEEAKNFFASCYNKIVDRTYVVHLIASNGAEEQGAHKLLTASHSTHRPQWRRHYKLT